MQFEPAKDASPSAPDVAVLLATHDSVPFIQPQIASLLENSTPFTLHWLDDHSKDETRPLVRRVAERLRLPLREWHQDRPLGVPGVFFRLLECVDADIYLFCDHDDIWELGKIDATVADLAGCIAEPALNFSEPWVFQDAAPEQRIGYYRFMRVTAAQAREPSTAFTFNPAVGNTVGVTRALRELFLLQRGIARDHAVMHDWWLYLLGTACGRATLLQGVPTALYRQHARNVLGAGSGASRRSIALMWERQKMIRRLVARQARGFQRACGALPPKAASRTLLETAPLAAALDRRQSPRDLLTLLGQGVLPAPLSRRLWYSAACLLSSASATADMRLGAV
ncbi:MAG TPA: glycosyltransferase [Steroidobacteraceae bacterium]|nr:glycosyltransferase [Steroidobacteraceae bacterium]